MWVLVAVLLVSILPAGAESQKFSVSWLGIFDTQITLMGFMESQEEFNKVADETAKRLTEYNRIFDAYNSYPDLHNLWYVNRFAHQAPVEIPGELYSLIAWCKEKWESGMRETNIAMGAVLSIWHDYRTAGLEHPETAALPPMAELEEAALHTDFDQVILDDEKQTVYFADPRIKLDIGAVAKGFSADLIGEYLRQAMPSFLLSLGGNILSGEGPRDGRKHWGVSVESPFDPSIFNSANYLDVLYVDGLSVVTSGDYWRYYIVDGEKYHHIIDPDTLMPARHMRANTIVCESSTLADFMTTSLFVLSVEDGMKLVESMEGVEALWVLDSGEILMSSGMANYARSLGASAYQ